MSDSEHLSRSRPSTAATKSKLDFCREGRYFSQMLCDQIIAEGAPGSGCNIDCLLPKIRTAQKFTLSPECTAVADSLSNDYTGLVKAFPHCRLPFPTTWIEFVANERPAFSTAVMYAPTFQVRPKRGGFLLTATRDDLSAWKAHLFWSTDLGCSCPTMLAMNFDMTEPFSDYSVNFRLQNASKYNSSIIQGNFTNHPGWERAKESTRLTMLAHTEPARPDYDPPLPIGIETNRIKEFYEAMADLSRADWAGEPAYLLAVIGLLNARNAVETETVDRHKMNKSRIKRGKPPMCEYKVLKIARRQRRHYASDGDVHHAAARGHFVMGHWKVRKTGIFFWHPHSRGDFTKGRIEKSYEVVR